MTILEITLVAISTLVPLIVMLTSKVLQRTILFFTVSLLLLHLVIDGYRWQMIPAYIMLLIGIFCIYKRYAFYKGKWFKKGLIAVLSFTVIVFSWLLPYIFPIFQLPEPTGRYQVGAIDLYLKTDSNEFITAEPTDKRMLMIKAWFPTAETSREKNVYLSQAERRGFALKYGLPEGTFNYLDLVETHTITTPNVAAGKFPVVVFSHGQYSNATGYYSIIEEVTSHGYIVLGINHTFGSTGTEFPDGRSAYFDSAYDDTHLTPEMAELAWISTTSFLDADDTLEKRKIVEKLTQCYYASEITELWASDIIKVIDKLNDWNNTSILSNHIDVENLGVLGHSQGGAAIGQAMQNNASIRAGINLDGVQWGNIVTGAIQQPFALVSSDWPADHPDFNSQIYRDDNMSDFVHMRLSEAGHSSFMDIPYMIRIPGFNEAGRINKDKASAITSEIIVRFFDSHLKQNGEFQLDELIAIYPELKLR